MPTITQLMDVLPQTGVVDWIGLRPERRAELQAVTQVSADPDEGLIGDHYGKAGGKRQVTLIQAEHFAVMSALAGREVTPGMTRRNIVVEGISLYALRFARFRVGPVLLQGTGICAPCSRMEENLGEGGYNAMRGMGGICAQVVEGGEIAVGDAVVFVDGEPPKGEE